MKLYTKINVLNVVLLIWSFFMRSEANSISFISNFQLVNACAIVSCGQGTCQTDDSFFGFHCDCYSGWKKLDPFPACVLPNCTLNFGCGNGSPSPPSPPSPPPPSPPPPPPSSFNISDPCTFTWCNEGTCKANGSSVECDCYSGSDNLLNVKAMPCFQDCSLGADCYGLGLGPPPPHPPPPNRSSSANGFEEVGRGFTLKSSLTLLILAAIFL